jgi:hypothetical protein
LSVNWSNKQLLPTPTLTKVGQKYYKYSVAKKEKENELTCIAYDNVFKKEGVAHGCGQFCS